WLGVTLAGVGYLHLSAAQQPAGAPASSNSAPQPVASAQALPAADPHRALLDKYCVRCHNQRLKTAGLMLDTMTFDNVGQSAEVWEKVVWKLRGGIMPPVNQPRPDRATINEFATWLEGQLDRAAEAKPDPGRVPNHRLNRAEYTNAIRDLLGLE